MNAAPSNRWRAWGAACLMALVAACGGGVETGGTGPTGSSYVEGPVTGFGSVIVAGIRFDDGCNCIEDADGTRRSRDDLRLGMRVEVDSGAIRDDSDGGRSATPTRIRIAADLIGPIEAIDAGTPSITVLGLRVRLASATVVDGVAGGAAALRVGDIVEVHGFVAPLLDRYVATRIERRSVMPAAFRARGLVRDLSSSPPSLRLGDQLFDLTATGVPAGLGNGQIVRLTLGTAPVAGRWPVSAIAVETRLLADRDEAEVEGLISALASITDFRVNGIAVDARNAVFVDGSGGILLGARVKVRGRAAGGVLVASEVELRSDDEAFDDGFDLRDEISALDTGARTFVVRGVTVFYGSTQRYDNGSEADLADGRRVRVRAKLSADRTRVVAERIEFL
jgi:Domain of unknown function (DUF5666)